ncbi:hypothetical protein UFOVP826_7 [uncultured Caudovirales phage]|uniref:Uncharacterized protein n=1 Tax=uncultured Caudovirales phage TaxID=2100421 RepID=A0A6J5P9H2_9CAUD|nr:hypothetical protein UFOVP826_7 [uncultured Caudovirales phage]
MIKIEKGVPVEKTSVRKTIKYPWKQMEIGDSFVFPDDVGPIAISSNVAASNRRYKPKKFEYSQTTRRCWRVG